MTSVNISLRGPLTPGPWESQVRCPDVKLHELNSKYTSGEKNESQGRYEILMDC